MTLQVWLTRDSPVFCALVNSDGEMGDFLRLPYFLKRRNAWKEEERDRKVSLFCPISMLLYPSQGPSLLWSCERR